MKTSIIDKNLISYCGLYCGNCSKFKNGKCLGCAKNTKASWCKIRSCNMELGYNSCADCLIPGVNNCMKFNNPIGKLFGFIFNSDREAAIQLIKDEGREGYLNFMVESGKMTVPRRRK